MKQIIQYLKDEVWYCGTVACSERYPISADDVFDLDMTSNASNNQMNPVCLSNKGRYIWMEDGGTIRFGKGTITAEGGKIVFDDGGKTLKDASLRACFAHYKPTGKTPDPKVFSAPQYCSWVVFLCRQTQESILSYARSIVGKGFKPGLLIIDDTWQKDYGVWDFNREYFPDPKAMTDELHRLGFTVLLWLCPYVSPDNQFESEYSLSIDHHLQSNHLIRNGAEPRIVHWFDGYSAALDFRNAETIGWMDSVVKRLQTVYGIDGFKLDAGDPPYYGKDYPFGNLQNMLWIDKVDVPIKEARSCFGLAGKPILQRLNDKRHLWKSEGTDSLGLSALIPSMLTQGLVGYFYGCADMVGGGCYSDFLHKENLDPELIVRWAQVSCLFPMVQFSYDVWNHEENGLREYCDRAMALREKLLPYLTGLIVGSSVTGMPAVRFLEYEFPGEGLASVTDEFMLGDRYLVAPVLEKGKTERKVIFPKGKWRDIEDGTVYTDMRCAVVPAPIDKLPVFEKG